MACNIPPLGAFIKGTTTYIYPAIANKTDKYTCPECEKDLIFKQGQVRAHHFAHYRDDNPCNYYNKPSESQIHKDAKMLLKVLLESGSPLTIRRECGAYHTSPGPSYEEFAIPEFDNASRVVLEHRFNYKGQLRIADVACIDNDEIVCIFEICNTHKTSSECRPEPWFEIDATDFIRQVNTGNTNTIQCIRKIPCDDCTPVACRRCGADYPRYIINLHENKVCTGCWVDIKYNVINIYLIVPYADKEQVKGFGARFDGFYKKWYVDKTNTKLPLILSKWKTWKPT
jgi:hypothetical protein